MEDDDLLFHHEAGFEVWRVRWYALNTPGEFSTQPFSTFSAFHFWIIISFSAHLQLAHI